MDSHHMTDNHDQNSEHDHRFDVAVIGGGTAAETLVAELDGSGLTVVVFEDDRVGGECPFVACMPTKAMLHDAAVGRSWDDAVTRRHEVVEQLDDSAHAAELAGHGATLIRSSASIAAPDRVVAGGHDYRVEHIVVATGSDPIIPPIEGIDALGDRCWTSADAMTAESRPTRLTVVGGGVIGCELATIFSRLGTEVHLLDVEPTAFPDLPTEIGTLVDDSLRAAGVRVRRGVEVAAVEPRGGGVRVRLGDGPCLDTDRLLIATGTRPRTRGIGLDNLGIDEGQPLSVDDTGRVAANGSVWAIGDVAGRGEYTHLANHQARVVADALTGAGEGGRRFDDVVVPACVFTDPPILTIGPTPGDLDETVLWESAHLSEVPRAITDEFGDGLLVIGVDRSTRVIVAAHGIGAHFDVLAAALVTAIDAEISVDQLARSMWPFPTVGELLGLVYSRASASLGSP
jgi:pyruvate/2-oxoglutarate dehydrogenase complex dihydrolipoamide dehydrogenase (E3) component